MGDLLDESYNDTDILISRVDEDADISSVEGAKEFLELHEEDPKTIDEGLKKAFSILGGDAEITVIPEGPLILPLLSN